MLRNADFVDDMYVRVVNEGGATEESRKVA